jgi:dienelactone hydrolase
MKTQSIEYHANGERFVGYLAVDDARSGKRPGVLIGPEGMGLGPLAKSIAERLAGLGYVAFALDYHGDGKDYFAGVTKPEDLAGIDMNQAFARIGTLMAPPAAIRAIAGEALKVLKSQPETDGSKVAAIGYCFGGTTAFELARSGADIVAAIGFHSGLGTQMPAEKGAVKAVVLAQIGAEDPIVPADQRVAFEQEMAAAGADWRVISYGGAGHSFTNPDVGVMSRPGFAYDKRADERSWQAMLDLFAEVFG